jgi:microcystin degradation protein MlrC
MRIAVGGFSHETNTFSPIPTSRRWFTDPPGRSWRRDAMWPALRGGHPVLSGFLDAATSGGMEVVPTFYTAANPTTGTITADALDWITESLLAEIKIAQPDGVLLDLHGAGTSDVHTDAEAWVLSQVRNVVGPNIPVVTVNDPHGNLGYSWLEHVDAAIGYKKIPHTDMYERGVEAGTLLTRILRKEVAVAAAMMKPPLMVKSGLMSMSEAALMLIKPPMFWLTRRASEMEHDRRVLNVSVNVGFGDADTPETGLSIVVHTDREPELAGELARELAELAWDLRRAFDTKLVMMAPPAAVERAISTQDWPVILADEGNNTAGGSPGDGTVILAELKSHGWPDAALFIRDAPAVAQCFTAGIGAAVELDLGGKLEPSNGRPVRVGGRIHFLSEGESDLDGFGGTSGRAALLKCGDTDVIVTEFPTRQTSPAHYRRFGVEPRYKRIIVVQSAHVFRHEWEALEHVPRSIIEVDTPGITSPSARNFDYKRVRRPIYPLDDFEWDLVDEQAVLVRSS